MGRATVTSLSSLILLLLWAVGCTTPVGTDDGQATDRELDTCAGLMPVDDLGEHLEILANGPEQPAVVTDFSTVVMVATCREDFTAPVVSLESTASADPGGGQDEVGAFGLVVIGKDPQLRVWQYPYPHTGRSASEVPALRVAEVEAVLKLRAEPANYACPPGINDRVENLTILRCGALWVGRMQLSDLTRPDGQPMAGDDVIQGASGQVVVPADEDAEPLGFMVDEAASTTDALVVSFNPPPEGSSSGLVATLEELNVRTSDGKDLVLTPN